MQYATPFQRITAYPGAYGGDPPGTSGDVSVCLVFSLIKLSRVHFSQPRKFLRFQTLLYHAQFIFEVSDYAAVVSRCRATVWVQWSAVAISAGNCWWT